jgi:16S rRNA (adenine1518-N6/adenine1519-N6)-dimethyltransferase
LAKAPNPKKSLGQHFLTDVNFCKKILAFAGIKPEDTVIEIGPGTGNLTEILLRNARKVIGIEYDPDMIRCLASRFSFENRSGGELELVQADILNLDWKEILPLLPSVPPTTTSSKPWSLIPIKLVGNLPYNISTRILSNMTKTNFRFQTAVVMVQREVARRITAAPSTKDYGYYSLLMQFHFSAQRGFDVPPGAFVPKPKVVSQVIKLTPHVVPLGEARYERFLQVIRTAFRQRRKTLWNNLKSNVGNERSLGRSFESCGIEENARPEQVTLQQYLCMTRVLSFPS